MPLPEHELYAQKQRRHNLGYALFDTDNSTYDKVRIGDVGYIKGGTFMRLFNAFHDQNDEVNERAVFPDNFTPVREIYRRSNTKSSLREPHLLSRSVRRLDIKAAGGGQAGSVAAQASVKLKCMSDKGAGLILKYPTTREIAESGRALENYALDHSKSWLGVAERLGLAVEQHDLLLVRECTLTGDWATVVWDRAEREAEVTFKVGTGGGGPRITASVWGQWEDQVTVPRRQGPSQPKDEAYDMGEFDQCIFLKGIRVVSRERFKRFLSKLNIRLEEGGEDQIGRRTTNHSVLGHLAKSVGTKVETIDGKNSSFRAIQSAVEVVAIFIFEHSDADIALIDDMDISALPCSEADTLEDMCNDLLDEKGIQVSISTTLDSESNKEIKIGRISVDEKSVLAKDKEDGVWGSIGKKVKDVLTPTPK